MRQITVALSVAAIGLVIAGCGGSNESSPAASTTTSTRPPATQAALASFLLTPAEIDGALGVTGTSGKEKTDKLRDDVAKQQWPAGWKFPDDCIFAISSQRWPACANRQFKTPAGQDSPEMVWQVGPVANSNGTLTATLTMTMSDNGGTLTMTGQRALTVGNNVVIDVGVMRKDPPDLRVKVASRIAGKVDKQ